MSHPDEVDMALQYRKYYGSRLAIFFKHVEVEPLCSGITPVGTLAVVQAAIQRLEAQPDDMVTLETGLNTMCYLSLEDLMHHIELGSSDNPLTWHLISAMAMAQQFAPEEYSLVDTLVDRSRFDLIKGLGVALPVKVSSEGRKTRQWQHLDGSGVVTVDPKQSLHHVVTTGIISYHGIFPTMEILVQGLRNGAVSHWQYDGMVTSEMVYDMHHLSDDDLKLLHEGTRDDLKLVSGWLLGLRGKSYNELQHHITPKIAEVISFPFVDTNCFPVSVSNEPYSPPNEELDDTGLYYIAAQYPAVLGVITSTDDSDDDEYMLMPERASARLWLCDIAALWQQLDHAQRLHLYSLLDRYSHHHDHEIHQRRIDALWQWHQQLHATQ